MPTASGRAPTAAKQRDASPRMGGRNPDMRSRGWDQANKLGWCQAIDEHVRLTSPWVRGLAPAMLPLSVLKQTFVSCYAPASAIPNWCSNVGSKRHGGVGERRRTCVSPLQEPVSPWSFMEAANPRMAQSPHPTAILHGSEDDVVPLANSERAQRDLHVCFMSWRTGIACIKASRRSFH